MYHNMKFSFPILYEKNTTQSNYLVRTKFSQHFTYCQREILIRNPSFCFDFDDLERYLNTKWENFYCFNTIKSINLLHNGGVISLIFRTFNLDLPRQLVFPLKCSWLMSSLHVSRSILIGFTKLSSWYGNQLWIPVY